MSSSQRKRNLKQPDVVDVSCTCRKPKLPIPPFFNNPVQKQIKVRESRLITSSSSSPSSSTSIVSSWSSGKTCSGKWSKKKKGSAVKDCVAVEKESYDPYIDFRDSMLQMIVEKEIYNWDDLRKLVGLYICLNNPCHHQLIIKAFVGILNDAFSQERDGTHATVAHFGDTEDTKN